jgi:hypothetical protein
VSKKNDMDNFDDAESDDLAMLGSRFLRVASGMESEKIHRARHDSDARDERAPKRKSFRPREKVSRDKTS